MFNNQTTNIRKNRKYKSARVKDEALRVLLLKSEHKSKVDPGSQFLLTDLTHEDVKDPCGDGQGERGEEDGEEPGRGIHGSMKALSLEMHIQLRELLL